MGTFRGDFGLSMGRNSVHGSDSLESAEREIRIWFTPQEVCKFKSSKEPWVYENVIETNKSTVSPKSK